MDWHANKMYSSKQNPLTIVQSFSENKLACIPQEAMDKSMENHGHNYIMEPVCTSALLKRNCSKEPLRSRQTPRLECDIQLETIPLKLSQVKTNHLHLTHSSI